MLDFRLPFAPTVPTAQGNWGFRGLAHFACKALDFGPDPTPALLAPDEAAGHGVRRVAIPLPSGHAMPGYFFWPKRANGATVALVHGVSAEIVAPYFLWIRALLAAGFQVLTFELDGHGDNPRELCFPGIEENVPAAIAYLEAQPEVDPARLGLLGVSLGGACIFRALPELEGIRVAATIAAPHRVVLNQWQMMLEAAGTFNPELLPVVFEASSEAMLAFLTRPLRWGSAHAPCALDFLDPRIESAIRDLIAYLDPLAHAPEAAVPMLVVAGEWDQLAPAWQAEDLYAATAGPKAITIRPRRNHFTVMADRPAIATTVAWFERWLAA
jgi:fermentation-respiration switch protein FrsA (DUF1100 family)